MQSPTTASAGARSPRARLALLRDIVVAPARAYPGILATRSWLPAYLFVVGCALLELFLSAPALAHVAMLDPGHRGPGHATAAQVAATTKTLLARGAMYDLWEPMLGWALTATTFTTVARFKGQKTPYSAFFALAAVTSVPSALGSLADGLAVSLRSPASFPTLAALATAVPDTLAVFAARSNDPGVAFLSSFGLFDAWSTLLLAYGFVAFARVRLVTALSLACALDLVLALAFNT